MSTPTIEIEATDSLQRVLEQAVSLFTIDGMTAHAEELQTLLADVVRARCLAKRYDEQQIRLPLPR